MADATVGIIIVAAGESSRMGTDKIFTQISGHPLISYTLHQFQTHPTVSTITLVLAQEKMRVGELLVKNYEFSKVDNICEGGSSRQESVLNGLQSTKITDFIGIHDGARPCISHEIIDNCINTAMKHGSAVPAIPITDTIKKVNSNKIITSTINRSELWRAQTPQIFRRKTIIEAYNNLLVNQTDDAAMMESLEESVSICEGDPLNIKVTDPVDIMLASHILKDIPGLVKSS
ncbi:MAG TPA: 2-C-methyl-D-erythritol 4-phosphate cytidylyltransferase [Dehalococcoidia bacterium]|jgi:2-C-methyl-D-erythritol 4-phosphate cytidylyltransferase|nr:2-C-methyl-D-erythritol 4-phosphate cytidylyltransferase [Dehalococcoidia bacterium]|tara:strand:- start:593 stop:1288 length:696 start_codon:yes stop_codon:yes gene_type:complete